MAYQLRNESRGASLDATAVTDFQNDGVAQQSKRQRYDSDSNMPARPKTGRPSTRLNSKRKPDLCHSNDCNPIPLPESVVQLFRGPHVFPKDSYHDLLKASGVAPTFYFKTPNNTTAFSNDMKITPDVISKKLRKNTKRIANDDRVAATAPAEATRVVSEDDEASPEPETITMVKDSYIVTTKGRQIIFDPVMVSLTHMRRIVL